MYFFVFIFCVIVCFFFFFFFFQAEDGIRDRTVTGVQTCALPISSTLPLLIGGHASGPWNFNGRVDELSLYGRALSLSEIQGIYNAGSAGKCIVSNAPSIITQPASQTVFAGANVNFSVTASGTPLLSYQWSFNGTNIANATTTSLSLSNVQPAQGGNYAVRVTNALGSVLSSNGLLTVLP